MARTGTEQTTIAAPRRFRRRVCHAERGWRLEATPRRRDFLATTPSNILQNPVGSSTATVTFPVAGQSETISFTSAPRPAKGAAPRRYNVTRGSHLGRQPWRSSSRFGRDGVHDQRHEVSCERRGDVRHRRQPARHAPAGTRRRGTQQSFAVAKKRPDDPPSPRPHRSPESAARPQRDRDGDFRSHRSSPSARPRPR